MIVPFSLMGPFSSFRYGIAYQSLRIDDFLSSMFEELAEGMFYIQIIIISGGNNRRIRKRRLCR